MNWNVNWKTPETWFQRLYRGNRVGIRTNDYGLMATGQMST